MGQVHGRVELTGNVSAAFRNDDKAPDVVAVFFLRCLRPFQPVPINTDNKPHISTVETSSQVSLHFSAKVKT